MAATHGKFGTVYYLAAGDSWADLTDEACTESGTTAQITDSTKRFLNPNSLPTFTDTGGETVTHIDPVRGIAYFTGNVTTVTVTGTDAYVLASSLTQGGYLYNWSLDVNLDLAETTAFQSQWKTFIAGLAGASGSAEGFFTSASWHSIMEDCIDQTQEYFLLQLFSYDPDDDQTGDRLACWVTFNGYNLGAPLNDVVSETISFTVHGEVAFTANS